MISDPLSLDRDGAQLFPDALTEPDLARIEQALDHAEARPGVRLPELPGLSDLLAPSGPIGSIPAAHPGQAARPVRAILFDKNAKMNWALPFHQDRTIAVRRQRDVEGFGPWSVKGGVPHVEPPFTLIAGMITLRVHLDAVDDTNAPLLILPGSHRLGRLAVAEVERLAETAKPVACHARSGDIWAYFTSILHASRAAGPHARARRVLQLDFSADSLPGGLEWAFESREHPGRRE